MIEAVEPNYDLYSFCFSAQLYGLVSSAFWCNRFLPNFAGDGKDSANGESSGLSTKKSSATRMVTRLRNPDSKLSQLKNQQVAAAVQEANRGFKEGKEVTRAVVYNDCFFRQ